MFIIVFILLQCFGEVSKGEWQNHCTSIAVKNVTNSIALYWTSHAIQEITGNSDVGTCTNPYLRSHYVDHQHQHYPMVVTQGVLANHVKLNDTFSLSQGELLIKGYMKFEQYHQLAGEQEIYLFKNTTLNFTTLNCSLEENEHDKKYKITGNSQNNCVGTCTKVQLRFSHVKQYYHMFATQGRFLKLRPIKKLNFTFLMAHASEILIKRFMILEHYTQLAAKTFGFPSPLSNETKQWKIQTSFECQYVQRGYFVGIMVLPIGILLLLIEVTCSCGKFISQLIQSRREGHYTQLRKTTHKIPLNKPEMSHLNKSSPHQKISDNVCPFPHDLSSDNKYHGESPVSISSSEVKREHMDPDALLNDKLVTQSNDNKSTVHFNENIISESVNLLIPLHESVEQNEASKHPFRSLSPVVPERKKEHEYPILTTFKTESMNTVSMMHAECVYIPPTTPSSCQLETILEIEEETDIPLYSPSLVETKHNVGSKSATHSNSDQYRQFKKHQFTPEKYSKEPLLNPPNSSSILPSHSSLSNTGFKFSHVPLSISYLPSSCYLPRKLSPLLYSTAIGLNGKISSTLHTTSKSCYNAEVVHQTPVSGSTSSYLSQTAHQKMKSKLPSIESITQKCHLNSTPQRPCYESQANDSAVNPGAILHEYKYSAHRIDSLVVHSNGPSTLPIQNDDRIGHASLTTEIQLNQELPHCVLSERPNIPLPNAVQSPKVIAISKSNSLTLPKQLITPCSQQVNDGEKAYASKTTETTTSDATPHVTHSRGPTAPIQKLHVAQNPCAKAEITASDLLPHNILANGPTICPQRPTIRCKRSMKKCLLCPLCPKFFGSIKSFFTKTGPPKKSSASIKQPNDFVIDIDTLKREFARQGLECDATPHSKSYLSWPCLPLPRSDRDYQNPHTFTSMSPKDHKRRDGKPGHIAIQIEFESNTIGTWV